MHIDAWSKVKGIDVEGEKYQIQFTDAAPNLNDQKLYLINLGGYDAQEFGELHRYILVVATNDAEAKQRGKLHFASHWQKQHTDRVLDIDDCIVIDHVHGRYVQLVKGDFTGNDWENTYITI